MSGLIMIKQKSSRNGCRVNLGDVVSTRSILTSLFCSWKNRIEAASFTGGTSHLAKQVYVKLDGDIELIWKFSPFWT